MMRKYFLFFYLFIGILECYSQVLVVNGSLTNPGSSYDSIYVGTNGYNNQLIYTNYNWSVNTAFYIGFGYDAYETSENKLLVYNSSFSLYYYGQSFSSTVGYYSDGCEMQISNSIGNSYSGLVVGQSCNSDSVVLTGGSIWNNIYSNPYLSSTLIIGTDGASDNSFIVEGGSVFTDNHNTTIGIGLYGNSFSNSLVVSGINSVFNENGSLIVGNYSSENTYNSMIVSDNGTINVNGTLVIGLYASGNYGVVEGAGANLNVTGTLTIGQSIDDSGIYFANNNMLYVTNSGQVNVQGTVNIGLEYANSNEVLLTGGTMNVTGGLAIGGTLSTNNILYLSERSYFSASNAILGFDSSGNNNSIIIDNSSFILTSTNYYAFIVGSYGSSNSLIISNETCVSNFYGVIGYGSTASNNLAIVTDPGSIWTNNQNFYIGFTGNNNSLIISNGGQVIVTGVATGASPFGSSYIGLASSGNNVLVTGSNSLFSNSGCLFVGNIGSNNSLTIEEGGEVIDYNSITFTTSTNRGVITTNYTTNFAGTIGAFSDYAGDSVTLSSTNSFWNNYGDIAVGYGGYSNSLIINAGTVFDTNGYIGYLNTASNNTALVNGTNSLWTNAENIYVGYEGKSGNSLVITNGGQVVDKNGYVSYDAGTSNNNVFISSNSLWSNSENLYIGASNPTNTTGQGSVNLSGNGTMIAQNIYIGTNSSLNFSGGIVHADTVSLAGGKATISFTGSDQVVTDFAIVGDGCVFVNGDSVTFNGSNSYTGTTYINSGAAIANSPTAFGISHVFLGIADSSTAATLEVNSNVIANINYLTINNQASTIQLNGNAVLSLGTFKPDSNTITMTLNNWSISNHPVEKIKWTIFDGDRNTNNFATPSLVGLSKIITDTNVSYYARTDANLISYGNILQENPLYINSYAAFPGGITTVSSTGAIIAQESITIFAGGSIALTGGQLTASRAIISNQGTLSGNGTVTANLTNAGTMAPSGTTASTPGTITVNGNYLQTTAGTLAISIDSSGNSQLNVNGNATFTGELTVTFASNTPVAYGDYYTIANITGSFTEGFTTNTLNGLDNKLWRIRDPLPGITIYLAPASYTLVAQNQNQTNVAVALNSFIPATSGDELAVSVALDKLTAWQYPAAFNQIMPTLYQSLSTIAFNQANANNMELIQRLWGARIANEGFQMGGFGENFALLQDPTSNKTQKENDILRPGAKTPWGLFLDGSGVFSQANSGNALPTYNTESGGVTTGLTYQWNEHAFSGLYSGYQGNYTKYSGGAGSLIDNSVLFGLFGTYAQEKEKGFFVDGLVGGGYSGYTMQRNINFGTISRTATSNPGAGMLNAMLASGYDLKKGNWTYGPTMNLQYAYFGVPSFNETGAQSLDLQNVSWNTSSMIYSLGSHVAYRWEVNKSLVLVPQVNLSWQHEFLQNSYDISANLGGINFYNASSAPLRDTLYTGLGFSLELDKKWDASLFYNAAAGNSDLMSQNIFLSLGMRF
ncbi:MAG: autotransporter domain-containing protein [Chthoniobacterales bacterium]|nr:autotransporter domain-containing protein [Chthoniobacterales bacterium]